MTQEDKDLLIKDLCARLPYGTLVLFRRPFGGVVIEERVDLTADILKEFIENDDIRVRPFLRPLSSMTKEEHGKYMDFIEWSHNDYDGTTTTCIDKERLHEYLNFIYSHHLDDNNFIEKGLALEAPDGMYK